jgi:putative membrane protein
VNTPEPEEPEVEHPRGALVFMLIVSSTLAVLIPRPVSALAQGRPWDWSSHPMMFAWGAGGLVMMLMMVLVWALLIVGLVFGVRWLAAHGRPAHRDEAAEILRQRYARGEIDKQEFEMLKRDLGL